MGDSTLQRWTIPNLTMLVCSLAISSMAFGEQDTTIETERAAKIKVLQHQKAFVEQELRLLQARPEGTALSTIPRSDLDNQPTRTQKESLESVPGVAVRPGGNGRSQEFTIR